MEIGIGFLILLAFIVLIALIAGRRFPEVSMFSFVTFLIGFAIGLFVPLPQWWQGVRWVLGNLAFIKDLVLERFGGVEAGMAEKPTAEDLIKFGGVSIAVVLALLTLRKLAMVGLGLITGAFLQVLLKYLGIDLMPPW